MIQPSDELLSPKPPVAPILSRDSTMTSFQTALASSQDSLKLPPSPSSPASTPAPANLAAAFNENPPTSKRTLIWNKLSEKVELEGHGQAPLEVGQRTDAHFKQNFTLWYVGSFAVVVFTFWFGWRVREC